MNLPAWLNVSYLASFHLLSFDFDGTIANTELCHAKAYSCCLADYGVEFAIADMSRYIGNTESDIYTMLESDYHIHIKRPQFLTKRMVLFLEFSSQLEPYDYVEGIVELGPSLHRRIIISSQRDEPIQLLLAKWNIASFFDSLLTVPTTGMPKFEILANYCRHLSIPLKNVLVFEDSAAAAMKAKSLGCSVIFIRHALNQDQRVVADFEIRPS